MKEIYGNYKDIYKRMPVNMSSTNFLELYTLHLIRKNNRPMYGLEIIKGLRNIYNKEIWHPSHSTLYPLLDQMVHKEYIYISCVKQRRKYYQLTEYGEVILEDKKNDFEPVIKQSLDFFKDLYKEFYGSSY